MRKTKSKQVLDEFYSWISQIESKILPKSLIGRKRLRYLLFEAAISVVGKNEEFKEIHRYYTTREKNPLKKMQSLIAVACKLIRVFHVILTKGISYDASKMLKDIRRPGEQLKAA